MGKDAIDKLYKRSEQEPYRRKLGLEVLEVTPGTARVALDFTPDLQNIFGKLHGGAVFSLLDEAFQLACNAHGEIAVALQVSIHYLAPADDGARLIAEVTECNATRKTALYDALVYQEDGKRLATGQALAYRVGHPLPIDEDGGLINT